MASYTVAASQLGAYAKTLAASTVDTVTFTVDVNSVEVSGDGSSAIYFTVDGSTPTVGGAATFELPAGVRSVRKVAAPDAAAAVKLISAGTPVYSVASTDGINELRPGGTGSAVTSLVGSPSVSSASAPATAAVTSTSAEAVATNSSRLGLSIENIGTSDVFLGLGQAAADNSGICLKASGGSWDGLISGRLWTGQVRAKTASGTSTLSVQEI